MANSIFWKRSSANGVSASERCLLVLDAPLGWLRDFGDTLADHNAGMTLQKEANQFFRRETDRFVQRTLGKVPLDVGADRIARMALSSLHLLGVLTEKTGLPKEGWICIRKSY